MMVLDETKEGSSQENSDQMWTQYVPTHRLLLRGELQGPGLVWGSGKATLIKGLSY